MLLGIEDGGSMILRNILKYLPNGTVLHHRTRDYSTRCENLKTHD